MRRELHRNHHTSCPCFTLKSKQLHISVWSTYGVVYPFLKISSEPNETDLVAQPHTAD